MPVVHPGINRVQSENGPGCSGGTSRRESRVVSALPPVKLQRLPMQIPPTQPQATPGRSAKDKIGKSSKTYQRRPSRSLSTLSNSLSTSPSFFTPPLLGAPAFFLSPLVNTLAKSVPPVSPLFLLLLPWLAGPVGTPLLLSLSSSSFSSRERLDGNDGREDEWCEVEMRECKERGSGRSEGAFRSSISRARAFFSRSAA
jgi:hypothetical protein